MQPCDILCTEEAELEGDGGGAEGGGQEVVAILKNRKTKWQPWLHTLYKGICIEYLQEYVKVGLS